MTEEEALTKKCCGPNGTGAFRYTSDGYQPRYCIASACMAWRINIRTETRHRDGHVVQPGEVYLRGNATKHEVPDGGYCGLAGAPT